MQSIESQGTVGAIIALLACYSSFMEDLLGPGHASRCFKHGVTANLRSPGGRLRPRMCVRRRARTYEYGQGRVIVGNIMRQFVSFVP